MYKIARRNADLQREKSAALLAFLLRAWRKEEGEVAYLLL